MTNIELFNIYSRFSLVVPNKPKSKVNTRDRVKRPMATAHRSRTTNGWTLWLILHPCHITKVSFLSRTGWTIVHKHLLLLLTPTISFLSTHCCEKHWCIVDLLSQRSNNEKWKRTLHFSSQPEIFSLYLCTHRFTLNDKQQSLRKINRLPLDNRRTNFVVNTQITSQHHSEFLLFLWQRVVPCWCVASLSLSPPMNKWKQRFQCSNEELMEEKTILIQSICPS